MPLFRRLSAPLAEDRKKPENAADQFATVSGKSRLQAQKRTDADRRMSWQQEAASPPPASARSSVHIKRASTGVDTPEEEHKNKYPIHHLVANAYDGGLFAGLYSTYYKNPSALQRRDENGFTPVYIAVTRGNVVALGLLLNLGAKKNVLDWNNTAKETAPEVCDRRLREAHVLISMMPLDESRKKVLRLYSTMIGYMEKALGPDLGRLMPIEEPECSCRKCKHGWLSPRMKFGLQTQANDAYEDMSRLYDTMRKRPKLTRVRSDRALMDPQTGIHLTSYKTFSLVYKTVSCTLSSASMRETVVPTTEAVNVHFQELISGARKVDWFNEDARRALVVHRQELAWRVEYALGTLVDMVRAGSTLGDGSFDKSFEREEEKSEAKRAWKSLPLCENDLKFRLVRVKLGLVQFEY